MTASANTEWGFHSGDGDIKIAQGLYEISSTQKGPVGTRVRVGDRVFRYAYAGGTALVAGNLLECATLVEEEGIVPSAAVAAGDTEFTIVSAAAQTDLAEGYMFTHEEAGEGYSYRIKKATANADTSTSTDIVLYDDIHVALTTSSEVALMNNFYYDLDVHATITKFAVGVAPTAVTANYWFWCQTWGPASVYQRGTDAAGSIMVPNATTETGSVTTQSAYTSNIVGFNLFVGTAKQNQPVYLRITP